MYAEFAKTTNLNIQKYASFHQSTKIGTHENKWIHSIPVYNLILRYKPTQDLEGHMIRIKYFNLACHTCDKEYIILLLITCIFEKVQRQYVWIYKRRPRKH